MKAVEKCRHCGEAIGIARVGRGLCRTCWNDKVIRQQYPVIAPFGGSEASRLGHRLISHTPPQ